MFSGVMLLKIFREIVLQPQLLFLVRYPRQPAWHIVIGKNYILEELTTEGDRIPKSNYMKIYIAIFFVH